MELYLNGDYQGLYLMCQSTKDTASAFVDRSDGESCGELPAPSEVSLPGEGMESVTSWYREDNDELFDPGTKITEDLALYARLPDARPE